MAKAAVAAWMACVGVVVCLCVDVDPIVVCLCVLVLCGCVPVAAGYGYCPLPMPICCWAWSFCHPPVLLCPCLSIAMFPRPRGGLTSGPPLARSRRLRRQGACSLCSDGPLCRNVPRVLAAAMIGALDNSYFYCGVYLTSHPGGHDRDAAAGCGLDMDSSPRYRVSSPRSQAERLEWGQLCARVPALGPAHRGRGVCQVPGRGRAGVCAALGVWAVGVGGRFVEGGRFLKAEFGVAWQGRRRGGFGGSVCVSVSG